MNYTPKTIAQGDITFAIPIYQRLFEWSNDNVRQLLDDLYNAFEKYESATHQPDSDYYIGMLTSTSTKSNENSLFLVDGQQRFTVMTLMACVMQQYAYDSWRHFLINNDKPRLSFISRPSDDMYLTKLIKKDFEYDGEIVNYNMKSAITTIRDYMKKYAETQATAFASYIFEHLSFFISELPTNYSGQDLNKYFERMNCAGKNLAHHEILKVKMLSQLQGNISLYMQLWNKIADVDTIMLRKRENETEAIFINRKSSVLRAHLEDLEATPRLINNLEPENHSEKYTIKQIAKREKKPQETVSTSPNGSKSVLRFPQLLLLTLYFYLKHNKDFSPPT